MNLKQIVTAPVTIVLALSAVALVTALVLASPASQPENAKAQAIQETEATEQEAADAGVTYEYVAQPGDSYSKIARKAVQTYGLKHDVSLSQAQILFAETNLTRAADSPFLNEGQQVAVAEATIGEWVERAEDISDEQKAAWQRYTAGVDFNTDNVGESR